MVKVCFLGFDLPHQNSLRLASTPISLVKVPTFFFDLPQLTLRLSPTHSLTFPNLPHDLHLYLVNVKKFDNMKNNLNLGSTVYR